MKHVILTVAGTLMTVGSLSGCSLFTETSQSEGQVTHHAQAPAYVPISHVVTFAVDSATPEQKLSEFLKPHIDYMLLNNPDANIMLQGSADTNGSASYNYDLGLQRAKAVKSAFIDLGVSPDRISIASTSYHNADSRKHPRSVHINY